MNKLFSKVTASALALLVTAANIPLAPMLTHAEEAYASLDAEQSYVALYAGSNLTLTEKSVYVNGSVYSGQPLTHHGDKLTVSGVTASASAGTECALPEYTDLIHQMADYDFTFEEDKTIYDSVLDLTNGSLYAEGDLRIDRAVLKGDGRIAADGDIAMRIAGDDSLQRAFILSENGDVSIDAANLDFTGIIYAPNGKVRINAKDIHLAGAIYADTIEINGTSLNVDYKEFFSLNCRAHDTAEVYIYKNDKLTLNGMVSEENADILYKAAAPDADKVTITDETTLHPTLAFSEAGEYEITLTATAGGKQASDTVRVFVTAGPVVNYTSTEDFTSGTLSSASGADNELKLADAASGSTPKEKTYSLDGESGIAITSQQNKTALNFGGDTLKLDYSLEGYGQLISGNGNDVILCIDNSGSVSSMIPTIKETALQIIESMGPNDRLGITALNGLNTNLTDDKEVLLAAIDTYRLNGGSDYGNGLKIAMNDMFDEESENRDKYIFLLADGENSSSDDAVAMEYAALAREQGVKIYSFEINPFSYNFTDTQTMQQVAIDTNGAYKLCPDAEAIKAFMLNMAESIYNLAARNVTFTTTVKKADWLQNASFTRTPDAIVNNDDGSVTLSWNYNTFEIDALESIGFSLDTGFLTGHGYEVITTDTRLISYNSNGDGSIIYLDDIIVGRDNYADSGQWTSSVYDSGIPDCAWSYVKWNADYSGNSAMDVFVSVSNDGTDFSDRIKVTNGQELALTGRYIRTEVEMHVSDDGATPVLYDLTIYSDETEDKQLRSGADVVLKGVHNAAEGEPVSVWLDINGKYDSVTDIAWSFDGGELISAGPGGLSNVLVFPKTGEYTIKATVTCAGISTESAVNITVLPQETLWQEVEQEQGEFKAVKMELSEIPAYATQYKEPLTFNILFENPEQVAWVRALYYNPSNGTLQRIAYIDEANDYLVSVPLPSTNLAETVITVDAFDWYGNLTTISRTIKMDRQAPSLNLTSTRNWVYPLNEATLTVTASDNDELAYVKLFCNEEEVPLNDDLQYVFSRKQPGEYVFLAQAADIAGNVSERSYTVTVREDTGLPKVSIGGYASVTLGNSMDLTINAYDNETSLTSLVFTMQKESTAEDEEEPVITLFSMTDADGEIERDTLYTFTPEEAATYIFTATATDREGNVSTATKKVRCNPDTTAPNIRIELSKNEILCGDYSDVTVTVTDDVQVADVRFYVDDVETALSEDGTFRYVSDDSDLDDKGLKNITFKVVATDTSGNERTATQRLKVELEDTTLPTVGISASNRYEYLSTNAYMTVSASDNIGVASVVVTVNGVPVEFDEDGRYYFDTSVITEYTIVAVATDTSGNEKTAEKTVVISDTTAPTITYTPDQSSYVMGDSPVIAVTVTDNYQLATVTATLDGEEIETGNGSFNCTIKDAPAGQYVLAVRAEDVFGNVRENSYTIKVKDTEAPVITVTADKERYAKGETPEVLCEFSDNVGVTKVTADINGQSVAVDLETGLVTMPEELEPGDYTVTVKAQDAAGNWSEPASVSFFVSSSTDIEAPVIESILAEPEPIRIGDEVKLTVIATDNSGEVTLTVTAGGNVLEEGAESNTYTFTAEELGEILITVRAEDASGNYTEVEAVLKVYRNTENRKLSAAAPEAVKPGEAFTIVIAPTDNEPFDVTELWLGEQDLSELLTDVDGVKLKATLSIDATGSYTFKAIGKDNDGYETETVFTVQVAGTFESELESEEMQEALAQTPETELSDELKAMVAAFDSPLDAYAYVYNNIGFEAYSNSRRGAVGAYELKRGNDFDQASLLIGLLREMGYPARYAQDMVSISSDLTRDLMAMDNFTLSADMIATANKNGGYLVGADGTKTLVMEETFVQVYVPASEIGETDETLKDLGLWVNLDTSIKASERVTEMVEEGTNHIFSYDDFKNAKLEDGHTYSELFDTLLDSATGLEELFGGEGLSTILDEPITYTKEAVYMTDRTIVQKSFNRLPSDLQFALSGEPLTTFNEIPISMADTVQFTVSNGLGGKNLGTYKISDIYDKRMTLQFEGNTGNGTIFEMGSGAIYSNTFLPALYLDGEIVAEYTLKEHEKDLNGLIEPEDEYYFFGNGAWRLGEECTITTTLMTNGRKSSWTDPAIIGNSYAMVFDTGGITSSQFYDSLYDAAVANGLNVADPAHPTYDPAGENAPTNTNYYDEDRIGSYLDFAGKYYFMNCDAYGVLTASMANIETGHDTKMLMTGYKIGSYENYLNQTTKVIPGRFEIDVAYNNNYYFSRTGDDQARNEFMYNLSYIESYSEGWLWETLLNVDGVSTGKILDVAMAEGAEIIRITADNINEALARTSVTADEEREIRSSVAQGLSVIIPDRRVTIDDWSGTGFIIGDFVDYNTFVFKISGGINGGSSAEDMSLKDCFMNMPAGYRDQLFEKSFTLTQSLWYALMELNLIKEFAPAVAGLSAVGTGPLATAVAGAGLINSVSHLVTIVNYRVDSLDALCKYYVEGDEEGAWDMFVLAQKMILDFGDTIYGLGLGSVVSESTSNFIDLVTGIMTSIDSVFGPLCGRDTFFPYNPFSPFSSSAPNFDDADTEAGVMAEETDTTEETALTEETVPTVETTPAEETDPAEETTPDEETAPNEETTPDEERTPDEESTPE